MLCGCGIDQSDIKKREFHDEKTDNQSKQSFYGIKSSEDSFSSLHNNLMKMKSVSYLSDEHDKLYIDFMTGKENVKFEEETDYGQYIMFKDALEEGCEYNIYELIECIRESVAFRYGDFDITVGTAHYSFIDCGNDGNEELILRFDIGIHDGLQAEIVIKNMDGSLSTCFCVDSWARKNVDINEFGFIHESGSSGANSHSMTEKYIDAKGKCHFLFDCDIESDPVDVLIDGELVNLDWKTENKVRFFTYHFDQNDYTKDRYYTYTVLPAYYDENYRGENPNEAMYCTGDVYYDELMEAGIKIVSTDYINERISQKYKSESFDETIKDCSDVIWYSFIPGKDTVQGLEVYNTLVSEIGKSVNCSLFYFSDYDYFELVMGDGSENTIVLNIPEEESDDKLYIEGVELCFSDYNMDGYTDIILICGNELKNALYMYYGYDEMVDEKFYRQFYEDVDLEQSIIVVLGHCFCIDDVKKVIEHPESNKFCQWEDAYKFAVKLEVLRNRTSSFNIVYLDSDDIPELIVRSSELSTKVYKYIDGLLENAIKDTYDQLYNIQKKDLIIEEYEDLYLGLYNHVHQILYEEQYDGKLVKTKRGCIIENSNTNEKYYVLNGKSVSQEEYNESFHLNEIERVDVDTYDMQEFIKLISPIEE